MSQQQKQHVDIHRKLALRRGLLPRSGKGASFVPFCGDGDIARDLYADRVIVACDNDAERVATFRERFPAANCILTDAETIDLTDCPLIAIADFDAYSNPYPAIEHFWTFAPHPPPLVVFGTDGLRRGIKRNRRSIELPGGNEAPGVWRAQYNHWWIEHVKPWLASLLSPCVILDEAIYLRNDMLYWGIVVGESTQAALSPLGPTGRRKAYKLTPRIKGQYLALIAGGGRRYASARKLGLSVPTVREHLKTDTAFLEGLELAESEADEEIESALRTAAKSGNVTACLAWLYSRQPERWADMRRVHAELTADGAVHIVIEDARDWRKGGNAIAQGDDSTSALPSGSANGDVIDGEVSLVECRPPLAQNDNGNVPRD